MTGGHPLVRGRWRDADAVAVALSGCNDAAVVASKLAVYFRRFPRTASYYDVCSLRRPEGAGVYDRGTVKATSPEEVAMMLAAARRVMIVPGYGMAAAQAQHGVAELARKLEAMGIDVDFAIHPVAGRMPGHMNVLLAEANVPYDSLKDLESANPELETTDVALVVGANDVVNPSARSDPESSIAGMPILDADRARTVVILKRSLASGFAGIDNPLFVAPNAVVLFGDVKKSILAILQALTEA